MPALAPSRAGYCGISPNLGTQPKHRRIRGRTRAAGRLETWGKMRGRAELRLPCGLPGVALPGQQGSCSRAPEVAGRCGGQRPSPQAFECK
jgi:hypothetical protein